MFFPRGSGPHAWVGDERKQIQIRRRFQLLGTTIDAMRVWDVRCAIAAIQQIADGETQITVHASETEAWLGLLAMIIDPTVSAGHLSKIGTEKDQMAIFPDIARKFSPEELIAIAISKAQLELTDTPASVTEFAESLAGDDRWPGRHLRTQ